MHHDLLSLPETSVWQLCPQSYDLPTDYNVAWLCKRKLHLFSILVHTKQLQFFLQLFHVLQQLQYLLLVCKLQKHQNW